MFYNRLLAGLRRPTRSRRSSRRCCRRTSTRSGSTPQLYWRIKTLYDQLDDLELDAEQRYLVERYYTEMTLAGAGLDDAEKEQLKDLNQRLSTLTTSSRRTCSPTPTTSRSSSTTPPSSTGSPGEISAAAEAAKERGLDGKYLVTLVLPTGHP